MAWRLAANATTMTVSTITWAGTDVAASSTTATIAASVLTTRPSFAVDHGVAAGHRGRGHRVGPRPHGDPHGRQGARARHGEVGVPSRPAGDAPRLFSRSFPSSPGGRCGLTVLTSERGIGSPRLVHVRTQSRGLIGTLNTEIQEISRHFGRPRWLPHSDHGTRPLRCLLSGIDAHGPVADRPRPVGDAGGSRPLGRGLSRGRTLSAIGMFLQAAALGKQVYDITDSEFALGMLGLVEFLPALLLLPLTGSAADRFDRRDGSARSASAPRC